MCIGSRSAIFFFASRSTPAPWRPVRPSGRSAARCPSGGLSRPLLCRMMSSAWIPGHILQSQRDGTGDGIAGDDVEVTEVGRSICSSGADLDVSGSSADRRWPVVARAGDQLVRIQARGTHLEHELVVGLIGAVLPRTGRRDDHVHVIARCWVVVMRLHRRSEVGDVEAATQPGRRRRTQEVDDQVLALLLEIDADLRAREIDDNAARAVVATAEVDVAQVEDVGVLAAGEVACRRQRPSRSAPRSSPWEPRRSRAEITAVRLFLPWISA